MKEMKLSHVHTIVASCISYVIQAIINNFMPLLFLTFRAEFGLSLGKISALIGINFLTQLAMDLAMTKLADKIGYRGSILIGHIFASAGLLGLAFIPDLLKSHFAGLLICTIFCAIGGGIIEVLVSPIVEAAPTENKTGTMSLLHSFYCWGQMLVIIISTIFFAVAGIHNWRVMAAIWAFLPAVNMLYFIFVPIKKPVEKGEGLKASQLLSASSFWVLFILMLCAGASELSMSQWASAFAESSLQIPKAVGDIFGPCLFAACMGTSRLLYSFFSHRIKLQRFMVYSGMLCTFAYLLTIVSGNSIFSLLGVALVGFSVGIMWPGTFSLASAKIPMGGTAMFALLAFAGDIGCAFGPSLVGVVSGLSNDNIRIGLIAGIIFPLALVITLLTVNKKLASRIARNRAVWMAVVFGFIIIALSFCMRGCSYEKSPEADTTPTPVVLGTTTPAPSQGEKEPEATKAPEPAATETPTPAPTDTPEPVVTEAPEATPTPKATATPKAQQSFEGVTIKDVSKVVYTTSDLNMRKGPGTQYDKVMVAKNKEALTVTGECSNGWLRVEKDGKTVYVSGYYTTDKSPEATPTPKPTGAATATPTPKATATPAPEQTIDGVTIKEVSKVVYTTGDLNMRKGPGTQYDKVMTAKKNDALIVTGECSNGWLRVEKDGKTVYVSGSYTTEKAPAGVLTPTPTATASPAPTKAPDATATPVPTNVPAATATPAPTNTPAPLATPEAGQTIDKYSGFTGQAYLCYDLNEDAFLYAKNESVQLRPASLTKMLTALVALDYASLSEEFEMPLEAMRWQGYTDANGNAVAALDKDMSCYGAPVGTKLTLEDWLNIMMLLSAADAADTIAYNVAGSIDGFVELMNKKAAELGMNDSHFDNPVGADSSSGFYYTYSSAADMAKLATAVMKNSNLRKIVARTSYTTSTGFAIESNPIKNINLLISDSAYSSTVFTCTGIKTGFTDDAGQCIAASGKDSFGNEYLVVLMGVDSRKGCAEQAKKMLEYLFTK